MRRDLTEEDMVRMCVPRRYWRVTLDGVSETPIDSGPSARALLERYVEHMDSMMSRGVGLLLYGPNSVGKTCAGVVVLKEARRRGKKALFLPAADLRRVVIEKAAFDDVETMYDRARSVDILLIDDLGKGTQDSTGFGARILDDLIRARNADLKTTWITTNMNRSTLQDELKRSTMHSLQECVVPVLFTGDDRRQGSTRDLVDLLMKG